MIKKMNERVIIPVMLLFLSVLSLYGEDNPATRINVEVPGTIEINPRGEALLDVTLRMPLAYFIILENSAGVRQVSLSFPAGTGLIVKDVKFPEGRRYNNDRVLSGSGTFQVTIQDSEGLRPGTTTSTSLQIKVQIASTKTVYAPYTLQEKITLKAGGRLLPDLPRPPGNGHGQPQPGERQIDWLGNYRQAAALAARKNQYMFIYFTSSGRGCSICNWMEENTLVDNAVVRTVNNGFIPLRITDRDNDRNDPDLKKIRIKGYPSLVLADSSGKVVFNRMGRITAQTLLKEIRGFAANNTPVKTEPPVWYHRDTAAVLFYRDDTAIIFLNTGEFLEYDLVRGRYLSGRPQPLANDDWRGLAPHRNRIVAALNWGRGKAHIFLSTGQYLRVDLSRRAVDPGYPKPVDDRNWAGLGGFADKIVGAVRWKSDKIYFFLSNGLYLRYDMQAMRVDPGYPKPINTSTWNAVGQYSRRIRGAANGEKGIAYFFMDDGTILKYDIERNRVIN